MSDIPLPCPFCGQKPETGPKNPERDGNAWGYVKCVAKSCQANPEVRDGSRIADSRGSAAYIALAIKRWNRRKL